MSRGGDVLAVIAHPDDEVFVSGTLCLCAEKGFKTALACATGDEPRSRELERSAIELGIGEVRVLGQPDVAVPDGPGPGAWDQPGVIAALCNLIRDHRPRLILTHGPLGGYGSAAHRLLHRCVMAAVRETAFAGSVFSFCGQVEGAFFTWHFDQPSDVQVDARGFRARRAASLSCHRSQTDFFMQPYHPRTVRKFLSALFGWTFAFTEAGRRRVPIATVERFFARFPVEGLVLQQAPQSGGHFFSENFADDPRVQIAR